MVKLTRTELTWIIGEIDKSVSSITNDLSRFQKMSTIEKGLLELKCENLTTISNKLQKVLNEKGKRIAIEQ
uniref:hypothetical protein n=1 Tax=Clostridium sp. 12(A) TaxID=1163671 RepID=UPI0004665F3B|nr:hypothetical protein [Clostridium sp. 12(A)]